MVDTSQLRLELRLRPPLLATVLADTADWTRLRWVHHLYSRAWGAQYASIHFCKSDDTVPASLARRRPDFVFLADLDTSIWARKLRDVCQPRGTGILDAHTADHLHQPHVGGIIPTHPVLLQIIENLKGEPRPILVPNPTGLGGVGEACTYGFFGVFDDRFVKGPLKPSRIEISKFSQLMEAVLRIVRGEALCWLDLANYGLSPSQTILGGMVPATVVVCSSPADLAFAWNLRHGCGFGNRHRILPIPRELLRDREARCLVGEWMKAIQSGSTYCEVVVPGASYEEQKSITLSLRRCRPHNAAFFVDLRRIAADHVVVPYHKQQTSTVDLSGSRVSLTPLRPDFVDHLSSGAYWVVDLLRDTNTHRAPLDVVLPSHPVACEVLNAPGPRTPHLAIGPRLHDGHDAIGVVCDKSDEWLEVVLPEADEILIEMVRNGGFEPQHDEKRSLYTPVIQQFGGLLGAAQSLAGKRGDIIRALQDGPLTYSELQGRTRTGNAILDGEGTDWVSVITRNEPPTRQRIARSRFANDKESGFTSPGTVREALGDWTRQGVIRREWRLPRCSKCGQSPWIPDIQLARGVTCPICGFPIPLPDRLELGYALAKGVQLAIREGLVPVALTGRFLRGLTRRGFQWLPGLKGEFSRGGCDVDIAALCDGFLVLCECKTGSKSIADMSEQLSRLAAVGTAVGAHLVVLACAEGDPPACLHKLAKQLSTTNMAVILLGRTELTMGYREVMDRQGNPWRVHIDDLTTRPVRSPRRRGPKRHGRSMSF